MSGWKKVAIWVGGVFVLFAACSELSGTSDPSITATSQPTTGEPSAAQPPPAQPPAEEPQAEEPAQEEQVATVGQPARDGKFEFVVTKVEPPAKTIGTNEFLQEDAQGEFVVVRVDIKNIGDKPQMFSSGDQSAFAGETEFGVDPSAWVAYADGEHKLLVDEINPGNQVTDVPLAFDVPVGTKLTHVELHDSMFSGGVRVNL